jgi:type II secretory pathway component PulF
MNELFEQKIKVPLKNLYSKGLSFAKDKSKSKKKSEKNSINKDYFESFKNIGTNSLSVKEQTFFIKRLSFLIKAGIPIIDSLLMLKEQTKSKAQIKLLDSIIKDVSNGQYLSTSLAKHKKIFGEFSINIISFGESTGLLSENLEYLAEELKKKQALKKKVVGAFVYPAVVTVATFGITGFLMVYLFPKIMPVFKSLRITLPLSTRIVIYLSDLIRHEWFWILAIILLSFGAFYVAIKKSKKFKFYFDKTIFKVPFFGGVIKNYNLANSTRTLGLLLKSGINVSEALPIVEKTTSNLAYKDEFKNLSKTINRGERISKYLKERPSMFPEVIPQIVSVGERSGNLSNSLIYLSEMYETEVNDFTKNIGTIIEPIMMIIMGVLVGFIAISIITPIYSITQNLHGR